ncbi:MAG: YggU family protein [Candidatus Buchananbacteria bacterium CG10_big_fil_rev_8_21_14_0_10_42_9]|uniref:YggU family protein n=1 Tax=Candidatus Buchananbacteria bacterium CG10_big_fil_rev_8_21_14_0_10_42_9 TaxID=1974526 RepID=A0A2H0W113_9BACT|nr:MAG: YggU family protein [Candidatus Buchananbacteria bacterium CG10_big_fil_rev_8_21_14_0_10_42_9]
MKTINVKVITKASRDEVVKISETEYKIKLTVLAERGKANARLIKLLSKYFNKPKSCFEVTKGLKSTSKTIIIR